MIGTKFYKGQFDDKDYADCAVWCNENNATIEDKGEYYECVEIPASPLKEIKAFKLEELKRARNEAEQQPVTTDKGVFDVDDKSITRITNAITVLQITSTTLEWTLADNTIATVNAIDLQNVIMALAQQSNAVHEKYRLLKEQVNTCETAEDVEKVVW